ncbi:MAG: MmcQ/YjbR family DNA-binding protein [Chloroflexota bacterium]|nr:MmcQ/YjbR family DNA-binding protein [Chloroflexota bacterium]
MSIYAQGEFDAYVESLTGGKAMDQWESRIAKAGDKVFATLGGAQADAPHIVVKVDPGEFDFLTTLRGVTQARYFAKGHWVAILEGSAMPDDEVRARIADSWALVAAKLTKKARAELGITLPPAGDLRQEDSGDAVK